MTFENLKLIEPVLRALKAEGYTQPTPIQEQAIPVLLERKDLLGCAQTGTGKTLAFAAPILQNLHQDELYVKGPAGIKTLILTHHMLLVKIINRLMKVKLIMRLMIV